LIDMADEHPLDNPAWSALRGPQADLAQVSGNGRAARYQRRISPIAAVGRLDADGWAGLAELAGPGGYAGLFRAAIGRAPDPWSEVYRGPLIQYQAVELVDDRSPEQDRFVELGQDDAEEMLALARLTEPGPFSIETYRTGRYFGRRDDDGALIAMAGERMRLDGWGEVSAVCVHPDARRRGLGITATLLAASAIAERGDRPMLHVAGDNEPAHQLYRGLGFEARRQLEVVIFRLEEPDSD
jgi:ribosomal protein S18 acetylase RimI-like enzyme